MRFPCRPQRHEVSFDVSDVSDVLVVRLVRCIVYTLYY